MIHREEIYLAGTHDTTPHNSQQSAQLRAWMRFNLIAEETKKKPSRPPFSGAPLTHLIRVTNTATRAHIRTTTTTYYIMTPSSLGMASRLILYATDLSKDSPSNQQATPCWRPAGHTSHGNNYRPHANRCIHPIYLQVHYIYIKHPTTTTLYA